MPALGAASFTVGITSRVRTGKRKMHRGTLAFGNGVDTYSLTGIPLPAIGKFGFTRVMEELDIVGANGAPLADYVYRYNKGPINKLQMFGDRAAAAVGLPLSESAATEAPTARTLTFVAYGW